MKRNFNESIRYFYINPRTYNIILRVKMINSVPGRLLNLISIEFTIFPLFPFSSIRFKNEPAFSNRTQDEETLLHL